MPFLSEKLDVVRLQADYPLIDDCINEISYQYIYIYIIISIISENRHFFFNLRVCEELFFSIKYLPNKL